MSAGIWPIRILAIDDHTPLRASVAARLERSRLEASLALIAISTLGLLLGTPPVLALNPSLDVSQYAHTAWKNREGFAKGTVHQIVQTPGGYLWVATEAGLLRFDGVRAVPWQPPAGQHLPQRPYSLLVTRDGTLCAHFQID